MARTNIREPAFARRAFTLLEVMVGLGLLTLVLTGVLGYLGTLHQVRRDTADRERANALLSLLTDRLAGVRWPALALYGTWTEPRWLDGDTWMGDDLSLPDTRCLLRDPSRPNALGLLAAPTGLENLRVFVEYYRAVQVPPPPEISGQTVTVTAPGLMDSGLGDWSALNGADLTPYRFTGSLESLGNDPVVVRVVVTWGETVGMHRLEVFTARRQS